jgi:hypothetical protein
MQKLLSWAKINKWMIFFLLPSREVIHKVTLSFGHAFTPIPTFSDMSMKCWNSAFNAQGLRVIILVVQVGAECVAALKALRKKERQDETFS